MNMEELQERADDIRKRLRTLEWDKSHNQLNDGMATRYEELKKEYAELNEKLDSAKASSAHP